MNHQDHVRLLQPGVSPGRGPWADFGSGDGAFTLALRDLLGPETLIFSIEQDAARLSQQQRNFRATFPESNIRFVRADFTRPLDLPPLEGLVIANALHFYTDKERLLRKFHAYLQPGGALIVVEYNAKVGNPWVPHPIDFETLRQVAVRAGYTEPELIGANPSRFLREIYSALARAATGPTS